MEEFGKKLSETRAQLGLTINDVSDKTKVRSHIIASLEEGNYTDIPNVYLKYFLKTYASFLKIPQNEIDEILVKISRIEKKETILKKETEIINRPILDLKSKPINIFKRKSLGKITQTNLINFVIYFALGLASVTLIYFALFTSDSTSSKNGHEDLASKPDTAIIEKKDNGLISYFEKGDSMVLEAKAIDTAWLRIEIDGQTSDQVLMTPGLYKRWSAKDFFLLSLGNIGAVQFSRNGQLLEPFGPKGSVVRNLKIMRDKIDNSSSPWKNEDSSKIKYSRPKKKELPKQPVMIEPSPIKSTPVTAPVKKFPLNKTR
jgi:hypothetical protein